MNYPNSAIKIAHNIVSKQKSRGAVLILAILIVALVAGLGIKFAGDYQLGLARAEGRWHGSQGRAYGASVEGVAIVMLKDDITPEYDSLDEQWAQEFPIPVEGGSILASMKDANSQLDLNSLLSNLQGDDPRNAQRYSGSQRMFIRLLQTFPELVRSESEATDIMEAVVDWADANSDSAGNGGAEESYYSGLADPYLPANSGQFRSVEELQMVRGITPELMKALRPYITLLPSNGAVNGQNNANTSQGANSSTVKSGNNSSKNGGKNTVNPALNNPNSNAANNAGQASNATQLLNINTLPLQLLRTINVKTSLQPLDEQQVSTLEKLKPESGHYSNMGELDSSLAKIGSAGDFDKENLTVKTDLLWLTAQAQIGNQRRTIRSLLKRGSGSSLFSVVRREDVYFVEHN